MLREDWNQTKWETSSGLDVFWSRSNDKFSEFAGLRQCFGPWLLWPLLSQSWFPLEEDMKTAPSRND